MMTLIKIPLQFGNFNETFRLKSHWENSFFESKKHFFELKKVLLVQKKFLWSKEIDLFTLKKIFWIDKTFFN